MYEGRKVIVVMPAGRRRYMPLIKHYICQHKGLIDQCVLWANTKDPDDLKCLQDMAGADPEFMFFVAGQDGPLGKVGEMSAIRAFYTKNMDPKAIYLRIDDDICYMEPRAIPNLVKFRHENPHYFCVTANMVNSGLCSHLHDRMGLHPNLSRTTWESAGGDLHWSADMAAYIHHYVLEDIKAGNLHRWMCFDRWELWEYPRFGIAVTAYNGFDLLSMQGKWTGPEQTDEEFFTCIWPKNLGRMNCICGTSLVVHYGYGPQRANGLETKTTELAPGVIPAAMYDRYKALAGVQ